MDPLNDFFGVDPPERYSLRVVLPENHRTTLQR